jgi:hypothetical protein
MDNRKKSTLLELCYEYSGDDINLVEKDWNEAKHLVKIFDNYAIEFGEWLMKKGRYNISNWSKTTKELLETFKKENGL